MAQDRARQSSEPLRLIEAMRENTGILTSALGWLHEERQKVLEHLSNAEGDEVLKLQGEARCLRRLASLLPQMTRLKDSAA